MPSFYEILAVDVSASQSDISKAYRKMALQTHPDRGGSQEDFKQLAKAYETLSDPHRRRAYDRGGSEGEATAPHTRSSESPPSTYGTGDFSTHRGQAFDPFASRSFASSSGSGGRRDTDPFKVFEDAFAEVWGESSSFGPSRSSPMSQHHRMMQTSFGGGPSDLFGGGSIFDSMFGSAGGYGPAIRAPQPSSMRNSSASSMGSTSSRSYSSSSGSRVSSSTTTSSSSSSKSSNNPIRRVHESSSFTYDSKGRRESIFKRVDEEGNVTIHTRSHNGLESVTVNGVEQYEHPMLTNHGGRVANRQALPGSSERPIPIE